MKTADNEFTFQSDGERPICVTEFCQPPLDGIHRVLRCDPKKRQYIGVARLIA